MRVRAAQPADAPALAPLLASLGTPVEPEALARRLERAAGVLAPTGRRFVKRLDEAGANVEQATS